MKLPEKIRWTLNRIVKKMRTDENVYGIGLFGSWSRGDAANTSDVDLLVLDADNVGFEYTERKEENGLLVDFNHIPKKWLVGIMPPELDQKISELQIFYDRDWTLSNTKEWVAKGYSTPERIAIRTEAHVVEADIYLSRATSALARHDAQSAQLYTTIAFENILKILLEITNTPFSNSRFIRNLQKATEKLEMQPVLEEYMEISRLTDVTLGENEQRLRLFKHVWDETSFEIKNIKKEETHLQVRKNLGYYMNPLFLQGMIMRTKTLIAEAPPAEPAHYMQNTLITIMENYAWTKTETQNTKLDLTTLIRALKTTQQPKTHQETIQILNLQEEDAEETRKNIEKTKQTIKKLRTERKQMIKRHVG